jgi:hypothetical protein
MKMLRRLGACLLLLASAGCVMIVPIPWPKMPLAGTEITTERAAFITPGSTHREDVIRELGQPYAEFPDLGILAYTWEMRTDKILWAVGGGGSGGGGAMGGAIDVDREYSLLIALDPAGRVVTFETSVRSRSAWSPETVRDHALKWAAAQELAIPDASPMVAGQPLAPGESALYVSREGGFWDYPVMALPPEVRVDGTVVGWLRQGEYLPVRLAPGAHTVTVDSFPRQSGKPAGESTVTSLNVQLLPGQAQYVTVGIPQLTWQPHWVPVLTVRSEEEVLPMEAPR